MSNYLTYRGKCKEMCEAAIASDSTLRLERGYYYDAFWGKQPHWWCVREDSTIVDPSKLQFPDQNGEYEVFDGFCKCSSCGKRIAEDEGQIYGNYMFCSGQCLKNFVM